MGKSRAVRRRKIPVISLDTIIFIHCRPAVRMLPYWLPSSSTKLSACAKLLAACVTPPCTNQPLMHMYHTVL